MKIAIAYTNTQGEQFWHNLNMPDGATVMDAIERSNVLKKFPEISLDKQKIGIYSKMVSLDTVLTEGDRVEIYRPITCDPKMVKRKAKAGAEADADASTD